MEALTYYQPKTKIVSSEELSKNIASFLESDYSLVRPVMSVAGNLTVTVEATGAG